MKAKILIPAFLFSYSVFALLGCAALPKKFGSQSKTGGILEPSMALRFIDLPVPAGSKFLPGDSYSFESSGLRAAVLKYQTKANPDEVVNFYKEQMPMYNWRLLNIVEYGERLLNFDREGETCIISLLPKGNSTIIRISLGPKPQILPQKGKETIK